jgi:type VI secretion system secreted protein VgrG
LESVNPVASQIYMMSDHEVARAVHEELQSRRLVFVPPRWEIKDHIERERARRSREAMRRDFSGADERERAGSVGSADRTHRNASRVPVAPSPVAEFMANEAGEDVNQLVVMSPGLQADLRRLGDAGWHIEYGKPGGGSFINRGRKIITVGGKLRNHPVEYVQVLAHEAGHAAYSYQDDFSSKVAYLKGKLEDEAAATMSSIRTQREILANGGPNIGVAGANRAAYNAAYDKFLQDGDAAACRETIGAAFGFEITSNTAQTYLDYYGGWYDQNY